VAALEGDERWAAAMVRTDSGSRVSINKRRQSVIQLGKTEGLLREFGDWFCGLVAPQAQEFFVVQYQRSMTGDFFDWHRDRSKFRPATAVAMAYLSDADTHGLVGGETEFEIEGRIERVVPKQGTVVVFDAGLRHRGCPVQSGVKYCLTAAFR
jgi:hypothetical protein